MSTDYQCHAKRDQRSNTQDFLVSSLLFGHCVSPFIMSFHYEQRRLENDRVALEPFDVIFSPCQRQE
jgi:hypothetical protein